VTFAGHFLAFFTIPASTTISVTNGGGGPTTVTITAGTYTIATLIVQLQTDLQTQRAPSGSAWTVTHSTGASGTGKVAIDCPTDTWSITWTSAALRDLLGFTANITSVTTEQTGANQSLGFWMPDCPMFIEGNYLAAPDVTDFRQTVSPTGVTIGHTGNTRYEHNGLTYSHVPDARTWKSAEVVVNESLQQFLRDSQWGTGNTFFTPSSKCVIVAHTGTAIGNGTLTGWYLKGAPSMAAIVKRAGESWDGLWSVGPISIVSDI